MDQTDTQVQTPLKTAIEKTITVENTKDDKTLIDVHVNNPLHRITLLLEQIKRQKALTFDIKGSLGLAGVVIVLTTFGFFGGSQVLCQKGEQTHVGVLRTLDLQEEVLPTYLDRATVIWDTIIGKKPTPTELLNRTVLIQTDQTVLHLNGALPTRLSSWQNLPVIVTGDVDSCSETISLRTTKALQVFK